MSEARELGIPGFLNGPNEEAAALEDLTRHQARAAFYAPLNGIDRAAFGGPAPGVCIMWRLRG